jgi:hypothetical protein
VYKPMNMMLLLLFLKMQYKPIGTKNIGKWISLKYSVQIVGLCSYTLATKGKNFRAYEGSSKAIERPDHWV